MLINPTEKRRILETHKRQQSNNPSIESETGVTLAAGGAAAAGPVPRLSLEDHMAGDEAEEEEEAQRKSATRTRPRTATTASATRCFAGRAFAAGLAIC